MEEWIPISYTRKAYKPPEKRERTPEERHAQTEMVLKAFKKLDDIEKAQTPIIPHGWKKCQCGKRIAKKAFSCKDCVKKQLKRLESKRRKCPLCKSLLVRNPALKNWWQCRQFGERRWGDKNKPGCSYQLIK